ncbi:AMP-binding protein [Stenotrophomonas sp. CD2]|nr:AMP-binding protein [Stenotrophomonas sp. CD2]
MAEWIALDRLLLEARPQRGVGLCDGEVVDHAGFRQRVLAWRGAFAAAEGRDWALYFDDAVAFAAALFGARHAGKRVFLAADNLPATLQALQSQVSGFAGDVSADYRPLMARDAALDDELQALDERACELCVFTSGSTGQPSAIGKRLDQLAREVEALQAAFGTQLDGVQVHGTVSHQHIYGLLFRVLWPLAAGRLIHPRRFFHEDLVAALSGTDTVLVATPAHLKRLPEQLDWASLQGRLRAVFSSGGPLPEEAARRCGSGWAWPRPRSMAAARPAASPGAAGTPTCRRGSRCPACSGASRRAAGGGLCTSGNPGLVAYPGPR